MLKHYEIFSMLALLPILVDPLVAQHRAVPNNMFTASGFEVKFADTPDRVAALRSLPSNKLVTRARGGKTYYVYADPTGCVCAFVGTPAAYQAFQNGGRSVGAVTFGGDSRSRRIDEMHEEIREGAMLAQPGSPNGLDFIFGNAN
jgi:hypothetical protein